MRYLLLIYTEERPKTRTSDGGADEIDGLQRLHARKSATAASSRPARRSIPTASATTVRVRDGQTVTTDGPVRRDQGGAWRLLPDQREGPRRGDRGRGEDPGREARLDRGPADLRASGAAEGSGPEAVGATG